MTWLLCCRLSGHQCHRIRIWFTRYKTEALSFILFQQRNTHLKFIRPFTGKLSFFLSRCTHTQTQTPSKLSANAECALGTATRIFVNIIRTKTLFSIQFILCNTIPLAIFLLRHIILVSACVCVFASEHKNGNINLLHKEERKRMKKMFYFHFYFKNVRWISNRHERNMMVNTLFLSWLNSSHAPENEQHNQ